MIEEPDPFERLESKITRLAEAYDALKSETAALGEKLAQKEMELQGLEEKNGRLSRERETIRMRVDGLLNRLDHLIPSNRQGELDKA